MPGIVADLIDHAKAHGWKTAVAWTEREKFGDVLLDVRVGRRTAPSDGPTRGDRWTYKLSWSCTPDSSRRWRAGLATTPDHPGWHDGPSVKALREVIAANPAPEASES